MFKIFVILLINILVSDPFEGLTLISTSGGNQNNEEKMTILIDNDGTIVNSWGHNTSPASIAYLSPDSILYVPCKISDNQGGGPGGGPPGGRFKKMNWNGEIIWDYYLPGDICVPHHDIAVLPNGNIIAICSETKSQEEALNAGIDDIDGTMTLDMLIEIQPVGYDQANIVWKWHFWDHLIQDINSEALNYGIISSHPERLDINCPANEGGGQGNHQGIRDWNHSNCISFNPQLNQLVISSRHMNEFYVIDHSTTIQEAASHEGGIYGKGGDFLYRWGNPTNYERDNSSFQTLDSQHGVNWIDTNSPGEGNFILFNNLHSNQSSAVLEIEPPIDDNGNYVINDTEPYGPETYNWIHESDFFSNTQSGVFRLQNGNTLITSANENRIFEVDINGNIEWEYQGNLGTARAIKYPLDYLDSLLPGDLNDDEIVNVLDVILLVNIILENNGTNSNADINSDGFTNILDVVQLVSIILE